MRNKAIIVHGQSYEPHEVGVVIVDHGSRRAASNEMLLEVVAMFREHTDYAIVEPAHMELAEPSIADAFAACVERGARLVMVHPYFLSPGRHWAQDIPELTTEAAERFSEIGWLVTQPLGLHPMMAQIMDERIQHCLAKVSGEAEACPVCAGTDRCQFRFAEAKIEA